MTDTDKTSHASLLWTLLLTGASTLTTLVLACATPFSALAALAALHMRRRDGISLMLVAWAASQITGFALLGHPHQPTTFGWAFGLGAAAMASGYSAYWAIDRLGTAPFAARLAVAYAAAFIAFKLVVLAFAFGLGGVESTIDPAIMLRQVLRNGAILMFLLGAYHALVGLGVPGAEPRRQVA